MFWAKISLKVAMKLLRFLTEFVTKLEAQNEAQKLPSSWLVFPKSEAQHLENVVAYKKKM